MTEVDNNEEGCNCQAKFEYLQDIAEQAGDISVGFLKTWNAKYQPTEEESQKTFDEHIDKIINLYDTIGEYFDLILSED